MIEFLAMIVWTWVSIVVLQISHGGLVGEAEEESDSWPT